MKVVHIDELADVCGYFTTQTDANNHYGCNHPDQDELEMMYRNEDDYTSRIGRGTRVKTGHVLFLVLSLSDRMRFTRLERARPGTLR